jgi:predicted nucleic acid-binding protein
VLVARNGACAQRLAILTRVREEVAGARRRARRLGVCPLAAGELTPGRKPRVPDTWIAATALARGAQAWTQDADFTYFAAVDVAPSDHLPG